MSIIIRWLGGVTSAEHAELVSEVERLRNLTGIEEQLELTRQATHAAMSARQDADSAANSAASASVAATTAAAAAADSLSMRDHHQAVLANHATELAALQSRITELEANQPQPEPVPEPQPEPEPEPEPGIRERWSLKVDPTFTTERLPPAAREWHARSVAYLQRVHDQTDGVGSGGVSGARGYARQGDLYQVARPVRSVIMAVSQGLRATGDPAFLETLDELAEDIKSALRPGWRGVISATGQESPSDPPAPGGNGYVEPGQHPDGILVWGPGSNPHAIHTGRDVHTLDGAKTWFAVAQLALAYHENGKTQKRDYWMDHLERWEAAWRSNRWRRGRPKTGPIFNRSDGHVTHAELVFCVHMHRLTGEQRWLDAANTVARRFWVEDSRFVSVASPAGAAFVWPREVAGGTQRFANPTTYSRYYFADILELHRLGFGQYAEVSTLERFANTITQFILLPGLPTSPGQIVTARDNAGGVTRGGIPASPAESWRGLTTSVVVNASSMPMFEAFDVTGRLAEWNDAAQQVMGWGERPHGPGIPIGRLMGAV